MLPDRRRFVVESTCNEEASDDTLDYPGDGGEDFDGPVVPLLCESLLDIRDEPADNEPAVVSCMPPCVHIPGISGPLVELRVLGRDFDSEDSDGRLQKAIVNPEVLDDDDSIGMESETLVRDKVSFCHCKSPCPTLVAKVSV